MLRNICNYSRFALKIMRIQVAAVNQENLHSLSENALMVCNHMSYLDVMVLASIKPTVFITSVDMGQVFLLGSITEIGGCVHVERRNRDRLERDISQIESVLREGFSVTLFPEGTSSNGREVLPFKRSLLMAALNTQKPIQPLTLKYEQVEGEIFNQENGDVVCWYGKKGFLSHFLRLLSARSIEASVVFHSRINHHTEATKHTLGDELFRIISEEFNSATRGKYASHHMVEIGGAYGSATNAFNRASFRISP
jgi:1-acyl-sn-glycerol-3-phosphate acyltransferase